MDIYYVVLDHCEGSRYKLPSSTSWTLNEMRQLDIMDCFATDCAQDYWDDHDGWESDWPLEFHLYESEDAAEPFFKATISMEMSPDFSASEVV
ncbi:hypothetical protein GFH30_06270 [Acinetobacter wanghuae]|uniref:Uncharacterized protein n=1 Tax=Acinetobacter wanghuae TaxID=2662362 RepID=A0ABX6CZP5_9GAMM|nr:hypothetical protein [Acinetobacter wanghuae]QGA11019.1 hypothetical protein GFH30_06270 [Acinetobacter wanghuae]